MAGSCPRGWCERCSPISGSELGRAATAGGRAGPYAPRRRGPKAEMAPAGGPLVLLLEQQRVHQRTIAPSGRDRATTDRSHRPRVAPSRGRRGWGASVHRRPMTGAWVTQKCDGVTHECDRQPSHGGNPSPSPSATVTRPAPARSCRLCDPISSRCLEPPNLRRPQACAPRPAFPLPAPARPAAPALRARARIPTLIRRAC